jgi:hypothetical protein
MAYENKIVQDEVRKLGGIPLILNQCNIDDNNPCENHSLKYFIIFFIF